MAVDMIQGVFRCALLLTLLAVSACGWQRYQAAPLDRQRVPGKAAVASLDDATLGAELTRRGAVGVWPLSTWTPTQLALAAALGSAEVREAQAALATALAARVVAGQRANPSVALSVEHHGQRDSDQSSHWSVGPSIELSLSPQSRRRIAVALADTAVVTARVEMLERAWRARQRALDAALDVLERRASAALQAHEAEARTRLVAAARAQVAAGLDYAFEWQTLELEANSARLAQLDAERARSVAEAELAAALKVGAARVHDVTLVAPSSATPVELTALQAQSLNAHPDILRALAEYDRAEHALAMAVAAQYPDLRLGPGYFFDQGDNVWSLVGGVVVPLFASHDAAIGEASAARDAAREHFYAVQAATIAAVQSAYAQWQAARAAESATRAVARDIDASAEALREGERDGMVDKIIVARAGVQQAEVATRVAGSEALTWRARSALEMAARVPLDDAPFSAYLGELYAEPVPTQAVSP
jgi:outer membrane protein TolC